MKNKYTLKHLLHQPEKNIKEVTSANNKIFKSNILPFPQITHNQNSAQLVKNKTTKFVVHKPYQYKSKSYAPQKNISKESYFNNKFNVTDIKRNTVAITKTFASAKIKCTNYFTKKSA